MMLAMDEAVAIEVGPRTRWCSVQAALYRMGDATTLLPDTAEGGWSPALEGMLAEAPLPPVWSDLTVAEASEKLAWRRWVGAMCLEEPHDYREKALHQRPAFVRFCLLSDLMAGGGAVDRLSEFGDELDQCIALTYLLDRSPGWVPRDLSAVQDGVGSIFVAGQGPTQRSGGAMALRAGLVHRVDGVAVQRGVALLAEAVRALTVRNVRGGAGDSPLSASDLALRMFRQRSQSLNRARGIDLSYPAACSFARKMREAGYKVDATWQALNLNGYLNKKGHRVWYRDNTRAAGGWA